MNSKIIELIGVENLNKISNKKILIVGIGGVGSFVFESLIRSGIKNITIIDNDKFDETNLNRQLYALKSTINMPKVNVAINRAKDILSDININGINIFLDESNINTLDNDYDYIIDACDTVTTKVLLIDFAYKNNIKIISCMGTGNRLDPSKLSICKLNKTYNDPLAKAVRQILRKNNYNYNPVVVFSSELPQKNQNRTPSSMIFVPSSAGILISSYVINDIIKED